MTLKLSGAVKMLSNAGNPICPKCGNEKTFKDFSVDNRAKSGYQTRCKACQSGVKLEMKEYYRGKHLEYKYGITLDDYEAMAEVQERCCAICKIHEKHVEHQRLAVDHDHDTGAVRALLCKKCNQGIGLLQDSSAFALCAHNYLKGHGK